MSPEMVREKYDQRTDVYSYGLTLLEMITQEYPYEESDTTSQTLSCLQSGRYPKALESVTCPFSRSLVRGCIEHDRDERMTMEQIQNHPFFEITYNYGSCNYGS
eukprot:sb/3478102/